MQRLRRRTSADERLDRELRDHVERLVADYMAAGLGEPEARRRARLELGGLDQAKEACRDVRPWHWLDQLVRDVRVGFRSLGRDRVFAAAVTIILALGLGTSTTMFSVLNAVVLRPLPYERPGELARISTHLIQQDQWDGSSPGNFYDWRAQSRAFRDMAFYRRTSVTGITFAGIEAPERAQEGLVGPEFFALLGAPPLLGRTFSLEEFDRKEAVVVLSEGLWHEQFGRSPTVLGQPLVVDGQKHTIVGVMPASFHLPTSDTRFWRPYSVLPEWPKVKTVRDSDQIEVLGRLAPGVSLDEASAEMSLIAARLREAHDINRNLDIRVMSLFDHVVGNRTRHGMWLGFTAVLSLLVIACFNVGGLLLARTARRRKELAVRSALGAGRGRLIRQLLAESVSLWVVASVAGVALAYALIRLLMVYGPRALPRIDEAGLDGTALAVAFLGGLVVVVACGTLPALVAAKADATVAFGTREQSGPPRHRLQDVLVAGQIAGALTLLIGAVLFAQSFLRAQGENPGYPSEHLLIVRLELPRSTYADRPAVAKFLGDVEGRLGRLPGVTAVGAITDFFIRRNAGQWVTVEGSAARGPDARLAIEGVTPRFFTGLGIELVDGRDFDDHDYAPNAPSVYIVSEALARRFWPGERAVGKRLTGGTEPPKDGRWSTVVGVIKDIRREGLDVAPILLAFVPSYPRTMDMAIRVATAAEPLMPLVRRELRAVDPALPIPAIVTAEGRLAERIGGRRFEAQVLALFAAIAVLLAAAGLYASLAYQVTLRTREIGIRSALGARRESIVAMLVKKGVGLALAGAVVGIALAIASARIVQSLLYQTAAVSASGYTAAAGLVLLIALTAAWIPAQRAARVSPMTALRED